MDGVILPLAGFHWDINMKIYYDTPLPEVPDTVAIDIEVFGQEDGKLHHPTGEIASVQICTGNAVYVYTNMDMVQDVIDTIQKSAMWVGHNLQYDLRHLRRFFTVEPHIITDTMVLEQDIFGGYYTNFSLADLCRRYLNLYLDKSIRAKFQDATRMTMEMLKYAAEDAYYTYQVYEKQKETIASLRIPTNVYYDIDMWMTWVLLDMDPVKIDRDKWLEFVREFKIKAEELQGNLGFNVKSTIQVSKAIKAKTGIELKSTSKGALEEIEDELASDVLEARHYRDAVSKYGETWVNENSDDNGMVRTSWGISTAATGRMSSSSPNLQNIPSRAIKGYRDLFVSAKGNLIVMDISAQEPRILACEANDRALIKLFKEGGDPHLEAARAAFNDPTIKKNDPRRNAAKPISLGTSYGLTEVGLAKKMNCSKEEAKKFLDNYFKAHPDIKMWMNKQRNMAYRFWYVDTRAGRRCHINMYTQSSDNNAINAPIQGGAADFTKLWMVTLWKECREKKLKYPVVAPIHDELVCDVREEDVAMYEEMLMRTMKQVGEQLYPEVPWEGSIAHGKAWSVKE